MSKKVNYYKNIVEIRNLSFSYNNNLVLDKINLEVHSGDYLGIVGPNGAGKSTLLKIMLGLLANFSGQVKLFGVDIANFSDRSKIAYVPQQVTNFDMRFPLTVRETVAMGRYARRGLFHHLTKEDYSLVDQALNQVKMSEYQHKLIGDLSGGQAQRIFIARALVGQPEIIFLDEPTTGVDQSAQNDFYTLLKDLNHRLGLTLVLVSHDIERLTKEAGHIACLDHSLVYHDSPEDFWKDSASIRLVGREIKIASHHHNH